MNGLTTIESKRRAVAPIIATLLMVAIAVVGGILIFVFTQGFFSEGQVVGPQIDNIKITGYNATNAAGQIGTLDDDELTCAAGTTSNNRLQSGDCLTLFITNLGDKATAIQSVRVFGETMTLGGESNGVCEATVGSFNLQSSDEAEIGIIDPNTDATLCIAYDGSAGSIKTGRTIPIQVETGNGQSSHINIINGAARGTQ